MAVIDDAIVAEAQKEFAGTSDQGWHYLAHVQTLHGLDYVESIENRLVELGVLIRCPDCSELNYSGSPTVADRYCCQSPDDTEDDIEWQKHMEYVEYVEYPQ
jgi:hypothetical protein